MNSRRKFLTEATVLSSLLLNPVKIFSNEIGNNERENKELIKPKALKKGDKVALIAPASNIEQAEDLNIACDVIKWLGFDPVVGKNIMNQYGYLAGQDKERAEDLNDMFARKDVAGIICYRGGYGAMRILPYIDYDLIKKNPKVFMGFSDITALLQAIYKMTGLVTFHGPVVISSFNDYTMEYLNRAIFSNKVIGEIKNPIPQTNRVDTEHRLIKINKGKTTGNLVGGNLTLIVSLLGTPYDVDYKNKILFIEEIDEEPYKADRMFTQLWLSGKLQELNGIIIGKMTNVKPYEYKPGYTSTLYIEEILRTRLEPLKIPVVYGYAFGHIRDKITLPVGVKATLDVDNGLFSIDENAVI